MKAISLKPYAWGSSCTREEALAQKVSILASVSAGQQKPHLYFSFAILRILIIACPMGLLYLKGYKDPVFLIIGFAMMGMVIFGFYRHLNEKFYYELRLEKNKRQELLLSEDAILISVGELYRDVRYWSLSRHSRWGTHEVELLRNLKKAKADYIVFKFKECKNFDMGTKLGTYMLSIYPKTPALESFDLDIGGTKWDTKLEDISKNLAKNLPKVKTEPEFVDFDPGRKGANCPACGSGFPSQAKECPDCGLVFYIE